MNGIFRRISGRVSTLAGSGSTFLLAVGVVVGWAVSGPLFDYSNTWQLFINTFTTIATFLMVFLIQNTQNRDGKAIQLKLDELIRATKARDLFIDLEDLDDGELDQLNKEFKILHEAQRTSPAMHRLHRKVLRAHQKRKESPHHLLHRRHKG